MMKYASIKRLSLNLKRSDKSRTTAVLWQAVPRGFALFLGLFLLLNLLGRLRSARMDENLWWIDLRWFPPAIATVLLLFSTICLLAFAVHPSSSDWRRSLTIGCAGTLALVCL